MFGYPFGFGSGISDFRVFRYRDIEPVQVFLYIGSGSDIFSSGSVILDRVLDIKILKEKKNSFLGFLYLKV